MALFSGKQTVVNGYFQLEQRAELLAARPLVQQINVTLRARI